MPKLLKPITCKSGLEMSVQASAFHYSIPKSDNAEYYSEVEVGFPTKPEPLLLEYADEPDKPLDTVYAYVPVSVVKAVIEKHGGIISGELPPGII